MPPIPKSLLVDTCTKALFTPRQAPDKGRPEGSRCCNPGSWHARWEAMTGSSSRMHHASNPSWGCMDGCLLAAYP